jgi:Sphingolipid Delta4-desaturase (DES)
MRTTAVDNNGRDQCPYNSDMPLRNALGNGLGESPTDLLVHRLTRAHLLDFSLFGGAESLTEGKATRTSRRTDVLGLASPAGLDMAPPKDPSDFLWLMTEEPHRSRRMEIMKAHPEVRACPAMDVRCLFTAERPRSLSSWAMSPSPNISFLEWLPYN